MVHHLRKVGGLGKSQLKGWTRFWGQVSTGRTAQKIACGLKHTCAILDNNKLKCWGSGSYGAIGLNLNYAQGYFAGQMGDALSYVILPTGRRVIDVDAGNDSTCAVLDNNKVYCWGLGYAGQHGQGSTAHLGNDSGEMEDLTPIILN